MHDINKRIKVVKYFFMFSIISISLYLMVFNFTQSRYVYSNSYNKRLRKEDISIIRGNITDRNDNILAESQVNQGDIIRDYKYGRHFAHLIGYSNKSIGSTGIEALYNDELNRASIIETIRSKITGRRIKGNTVKLTVDKDLQVYSSELLKGKKGSILVINPKTGEILAMVSKSDYEPKNVAKNWDSLIKDDNSPLLNRATDGLYPPGSIFKIITSSAALNNGLSGMQIECTGKVNVEGYEIKDSNEKAHGYLDLEKAFIRSCNSYFVHLGLNLGPNNLYNEGKKFRFNKSLHRGMKLRGGSFSLNKDNKHLAQQSIGQGDVLITPLHAALIASTIGNKGIMIEPSFVHSIHSNEGRTIRKFPFRNKKKVIDPIMAEKIKSMMIETVESGTGTNAQIKGVKVAGKTGTAENPHGNPHSWFVGFAPAEDPEVAIAIIIENGGSGSKAAAPMAGKVMKKALDSIKNK